MGKRELLLIVCFVIIGAVVYQATAPPPDPNERGFSISRLVDAARREIRGNRASAVIATSSAVPLDPDVSEVRVIQTVHELEIIGEDRADIDASLRVHSNAYDETEAKRYAEQTVLKPDRAGTSLIFRVQYVTGRHTGRQRALLTLKVPSRLRARIESRPARLTVSNIAAVEATNSGGEATLRNIAGRVVVTHRGGRIGIDNVAALKLTGRGAEIKVTRVSGEASIVIEQGGDFTASALGGPLEVESRNAEVRLEQLQATRGPIRVNAVNGSVRMDGITSEARVDGRNAELDIVVADAAPISIYSEGAELVLTPPPDGFRMDAVVVDGRIEPETAIGALGLELSSDPAARETRLAGTARGGGPTITVRTTRGNLTIGETGRHGAAVETPRAGDR